MSVRVVVSSPSLELSGANVLVANLLDQVQQSGHQTEWLVTGHRQHDDAAWLGPRRFQIHRLPPTKVSAVRQRQQLLREFLEQRAPCVYLPNFDFDMACVTPALSPTIPVVLLMHCDDPVYYDFVARHGQWFNAIVCVSEFLSRQLRSAHPELQERVLNIPFGVTPPAALPVRNTGPNQTLHVAYCGRLAFHQKRVQDLAQIINHCHAANLPVQFQIAGTGPDEAAFYEIVQQPLAAGKVRRLGLLPNAEVLKLLAAADVLVMTSDFEGLPVVLLEAMSRGCVPVVTRTESGVEELVESGVNGFLLPVGDVAGFVARLQQLAGDAALRSRLRAAAFERIRSGGFTLERAAGDYHQLFASLVAARGSVRRKGRPIVPSHYRLHQRLFRQVGKLFGPA